MPVLVVDRMRSRKGNFGLDASTVKHVDLIEADVIDATKMVRLALVRLRCKGAFLRFRSTCPFEKRHPAMNQCIPVLVTHVS